MQVGEHRCGAAPRMRRHPYATCPRQRGDARAFEQSARRAGVRLNDVERFGVEETSILVNGIRCLSAGDGDCGRAPNLRVTVDVPGGAGLLEPGHVERLDGACEADRVLCAPGVRV